MQSARRCKARRVAKRRRKFQYPDYPLQEVTSLVVKRTSVSWTMHGQTSRSMLSQLLPGAESENRRWSTIGSDEWLLNSIVLPNSYLAGLFTDRAPAEALRLPMSFLMRLSIGLATQIHGLEQHGRKAKGWRSSLGIGEPCLS